MREIQFIVIHCTYTPPSADIGVEEIRKWHVEERGWTDIGYHFAVRRDGTVEVGRPIERPGAHVKGHNSNSIGIAWVGGMAQGAKKPEDNRTEEQNEAMVDLIKDLQQKFPGAAVMGHRDFRGVKKQCPCFDVREWYKESCNTEKKDLETEAKPADQVKEEPGKTVRLSTIFKFILSITWKLWKYHRSTQRR